MQSTRDSFIENLKQEFINPEVRKICIESSRQRINSGLVTRAFDGFPSLMALDALLSIATDFESLFNQIKKIEESSGKIQLSNIHDRRAFEAWEKNIITHACVDLLDENGKVKNEIVTLLSWESCVNKINVMHLISAYATAVSQAAIKMANKKTEAELLVMNKNNELEMMKHAAVIMYLQKNLHAWIIEVTKLLNLPIVVDRKENIKPDAIRNTRGLSDDDKLKIGVGLGVAGMVVAGAATLGILLFSKNSDVGAGDTLDKLLQPPRL